MVVSSDSSALPLAPPILFSMCLTRESKPVFLVAETEKTLLSKIKNDFIGLDTVYKLADGKKTSRIYFDSTASTLMMGSVHDLMEGFLDHYANSHSILHFSAKITTNQYNWAHQRVLSFLGADPDKYTCFFTGMFYFLYILDCF